jgi:hypothetical protein
LEVDVITQEHTAYVAALRNMRHEKVFYAACISGDQKQKEIKHKYLTEGMEGPKCENMSTVHILLLLGNM